MLIDSHAHLDMYDGAEELAGVLARAEASGVGGILAIGIGEGPETMHQALAVAKEHAGRSETGTLAGGASGGETAGRGLAIWASVGIHPEQAHNARAEALEDLARLAADPLCVAVGEIGLDYYHASNPEIAVQKEAFIAQMRVAREVGRPILIHCRALGNLELAKAEAKEKYGAADAWDDLLELLDDNWPVAMGGVMHCFSGTVEQARRSVEAGFYLSFAGNVTYPKSDEIRQAAAECPAERLLVETDCPFLAPIPYRGQRCEPAMMTHTAGLLAGLRGISAEELARLTTQNFQRLFPAAAMR